MYATCTYAHKQMQALIAQRFPDGIPEYTGPLPDDDENCVVMNPLDGSSGFDPSCLMNESDGSDDWLSSIADVLDDDEFTDLPDADDL